MKCRNCGNRDLICYSNQLIHNIEIFAFITLTLGRKIAFYVGIGLE